MSDTKKEETTPTEEVKKDEPFVPKIYKICLTGGPCGGKTSASTLLKERLGSRFILYFLPEMAATTVTAGVTIIPSEFTPDTHTVFTEGIMKAQMELEDYFAKIASIQKKDVIIISDRGVIDNLAYCVPEVKQRVLKMNNWEIEKIRDERYDAVIHLVTAADGAEKFYTLENNQARSETPEVACWIDKRTQAVWSGHPNFTVISNTTVESFKEKMEVCFNTISKVIEVPEIPRFQIKYLIKGLFDTKVVPEEISTEEYTETVHYLPSEAGEQVWVKERITKTTKGATYSYTRRKLAAKESEKLELTRIINHREYESYMKMLDKSKFSVDKDICVFVYQNQCFNIETFTTGEGSLISVLRLASNDLKNVKLPDFIEIESEPISEDPKYFTWNLAAKERTVSSKKE